MFNVIVFAGMNFRMSLASINVFLAPTCNSLLTLKSQIAFENPDSCLSTQGSRIIQKTESYTCRLSREHEQLQ